MNSARERSVASGDLRLRVYEQGDPTAPPVVLVHGYPDNATIWDGVADRLAGRFRVIRYDVRGHGHSDKPKTRAEYGLDHLVADLEAVVNATGGPVHLVAHDWGSIQSWHAVTERPHLFASFTSISGPSLDHVSDWIRRNRRHPIRVLRLIVHSWYIAGFKIPVLPELLWRVPAVRKRLHAQYRDLRNGLELYRENIPSGRPPRSTTVPVQQIVLTRDPYVTPTHATTADPWAENLWRRRLHTDHWAPRTNPGAVARMVTEFIDHLDGAPPSRGLAKTLDSFERQLVVITGAGSGIGRATAEAFAKQGAEVIAVDVDADAAKRTAVDVKGHAYQLDVADGDATRRLAERIAQEHGVPDIVMANAGIAVAGPFLKTSEEDWRRVVDVNLWGVVHTLRAFAPHLVERGEGGHLVVTASMAGYFPTAALPAYSTTKSAVLMLAQCLSQELAPHGVNVSAICPGVVHTNITRNARFAGADPEQQKAQQDDATRTYRRRGFGPERVAAAVLDAVKRNRLVVPVTPESKVVHVLNRVSPRLVRMAGRLAGSARRQ
jgi:NAD(P)-dependent dehydrogenase (short-subunit alcohol dehydrogenase family)/pimeloyl-ACP methyl ester carboxylesterase